MQDYGAHKMASWGPSMCHYGGVRPLLIVETNGHPAVVSTGIVSCALVYYSAITERPPVRTTLSIVVPAIALTIGITELDRYGQYALYYTGAFIWALAKRRQRLTSLFQLCIAASTIGATAFQSSCNNTTAIVGDSCLLAIALVHAVATLNVTQRPPLAKMLAFAEATLIVIVLAARPNELYSRESHLTWWGLLTLAIFDWFYVRDYADIVWLGVLIFFTNIICGVWFMSISKCKMLSDTLMEVGVAKYAVGNFAMHYWPFLRVVLYTPSRIINPARQLATVLGLIALYCSTRDASAVYGCSDSLEPWIALVSFWGLTLVSTALIAICGPLLFPNLL